MNLNLKQEFCRAKFLLFCVRFDVFKTVLRSRASFEGIGKQFQETAHEVKRQEGFGDGNFGTDLFDDRVLVHGFVMGSAFGVR
jgi:hypothetical protein